MGDVIDFRSRVKLNEELRVNVEVDPQTKIEHCIVTLWKSLGGFDLELDEFTYLMVFMAFSDICFTELENENMNVHENGTMSIKPELHERLKGTMNGFKTTPPANDE